METSESIQSASRETCLGLPFVEERPINEEERVALQKEARQSLGRSCVWGCSAPFVFFIFLCIMVSVFPNNNDASALGVIVMILGLTAEATFFLQVKDKYKLRKIAKQDLRNGNMKCYRGFLPRDQLGVSGYRRRLTAAKLAGVDVSVFEPVTLEVFCDSRRLWRVNGTHVKKVVCVPEGHAAFQPVQAQIFTKNTTGFSQNERRELSPQETYEIRRRSRTAWREPGLVALLFTTFWGALAIWQWQICSHTHSQWNAYLFVIFIALIIWFNFDFAEAAWESWRLSKDAKHGIVVITRLPNEMNGDEVLRKGSVIEWLPYSNFNWTINGEPAQWRLRG